MNNCKEKEPHEEMAQKICLGIKGYEINSSSNGNINTMTITVYVNTKEKGLKAHEEVLNRVNQFVIG